MTGVKYIDLGGFNFNLDGSDRHVIKGIYDAIKSTRKRIVLTNVKWSDVESNDIEVAIRKTGNEFYLSQKTDTTNRLFKVNSNDEVSLLVNS